MNLIKQLYKGESLSFSLVFPNDYDMARIESHSIWIGEQKFVGVLNGQAIELFLKSSETANIAGVQKLFLWLDDATFGVKKYDLGSLDFVQTKATDSNESINLGFDVLVTLSITETAITVDNVLYNYFKGADGNGIESTELISTIGLVKTYRITYTDATTFDYEVKDGDIADLPVGVVIDANYVHTDNNLTDELIETIGSSIQSETDPTVPSWAKEPTKPTYNKTDVGLGDVDNTSDLNKPISTATQSALDLKQTVFTGICQQQYLTENDIVIDNVNRTLTIATVKNGTAITALNPICFYTDGNGIAVKHILTTPQSVSFAGLVGTLNTGVWYFYFTNLGVLVASKTAWTNFDLIAPIFRLYWNEETAFVALNPAQDKDVIHSVEYHKNDISWADHAWKHSEGTRWINGFEISHNRLASGSPNANGSNSVVALSTGTNLDDNLFYKVSNVASPTAKFTQNLGSGTLPATSGRFIPTYNLTAADLRKLPATEYPFVFDNNNVPCYITANGVITPVTNNYYFVYYLYALQDERVGEAVKIRSAEVQFSTPTLAAAHSWEQLQTTFPTLKDPEIRILYKLTFEHRSTYNVAVAKESCLRVVDDLRKQKTTTTATAGGTLPATSITEVTDGNVQTAIDNVRLSITTLKKVCSVQVLSGTSAWSIANGKAYIRIPSALNGMNLVMCGMSVVTKSSSGTPTIQLSRGRQATSTDDFTFVSMLSTPLTIDANEYDSKDATAYVIDTTKDDVATGDVIRVDLTAIGTGTKGLNLTLTFSL